MELMKGRPADTMNRLPREVHVYDVLDEIGLTYYRTDHAPVDHMEDCYEIDAVLEATICKNLFLCNRQKTQYYLLMMPGEKVFKTKELSNQIHSARLSFAPAEKMEEYLDILPGAVSVLGLMNDKEHQVQLLVDEDVLNAEYVGCHPCVNTSSLRLKTSDIFNTFLKEVSHDYITVVLSE